VGVDPDIQPELDARTSHGIREQNLRKNRTRAGSSARAHIFVQMAVLTSLLKSQSSQRNGRVLRFVSERPLCYESSSHCSKSFIDILLWKGLIHSEKCAENLQGHERENLLWNGVLKSRNIEIGLQFSSVITARLNILVYHRILVLTYSPYTFHLFQVLNTLLFAVFKLVKSAEQRKDALPPALDPVL
jgi:hypothetical protein